MPDSRAKTEFVFDHIIESRQPHSSGRPSGMAVSLFVLLTITVAAALFVHPPTAPKAPAHVSVVAQAW